MVTAIRIAKYYHAGIRRQLPEYRDEAC